MQVRRLTKLAFDAAVRRMLMQHNISRRTNVLTILFYRKQLDKIDVSALINSDQDVFFDEATQQLAIPILNVVSHSDIVSNFLRK